jgi:hypothetical protein
MQPEVRRTVLLSAGIYAGLFVAHIIAAANGADILFRIIATAITLQTFFLGGTFLFFLVDSSQTTRGEAFQIGAFLSLPLSFGLGWAYAGMQWSSMILIFPLIVIVTHFFLWYSLQSKSVI